jgi:hypothetical protein
MIYDGELLREYQNQVTDNQFQLEIYQAEEEYTVSCVRGGLVLCICD